MLIATIALILISFAAEQNATELPIVEQTVELISVAHIDDGVSIVFFWDQCAGMWTCLDHRWLSPVMVLAVGDGVLIFAWPDENDNCFRVIRARSFVESWEVQNPLAELNQRPWFRQLLNPGLAKAPRRPQ